MQHLYNISRSESASTGHSSGGPDAGRRLQMSGMGGRAYGNRTRVTGLKGPRPGPLDERPVPAADERRGTHQHSWTCLDCKESRR